MEHKAMPSGSCTYQKGDLIRIRQASLLYKLGKDRVAVSTTSSPTYGIFLGYWKEHANNFAAHVDTESGMFFNSPCLIAVGTQKYIVDAKNFNFHTERRKHEKVN